MDWLGFPHATKPCVDTNMISYSPTQIIYIYIYIYIPCTLMYTSLLQPLILCLFNLFYSFFFFKKKKDFSISLFFFSPFTTTLISLSVCLKTQNPLPPSHMKKMVTNDLSSISPPVSQRTYHLLLYL